MIKKGGTLKLHNGVELPQVGFGVYKLGEKTVESVLAAVASGYRSIDTATRYKNEDLVGEAVRTCGLKRSELFVATKVWNDDQREHRQRQAFEDSLRMLDIEYIDMYMVHWAIEGCYTETWKILEKLYEEKLVRAIGVCNFEIHHLEELDRHADIMPMVNQIEIHPKNTRKELIRYCRERGIVCEAWAPLGSGTVLEEPVLLELSKKYEKTPAQVILRWDLQSGVAVIPRSSNPARIAQNIDLYDFELEEEDMAKIDALNENWINPLSGGDPNNVTF